jgi:hypothetical protein
MRMAKGCLWAVLCAILAGGQIARAAAITYQLTSGEVTAVTLDFDATNRLQAPVSLDAGQVNVDFDALLLNILSVSAAGPGVVALNGTNGWDSVTFTNASFASTQGTALTVGLPGNYNYGVPVQVIADLQLQPGNVLVNDFTAQSGATGTIIALNGNQTVDITINGVVLGALQDPINPNAPPVLVKADFHFVAGQAPEPALGALALLGVSALVLRRRLG